MTPIRIAPITPPYQPEVAALLAKWMPPGVAVEPLALFRTLARRPDLLDRARPIGAALLAKGRLPASDRELVIDRTSYLCGAEYEWGVHVAAYAEAVGLTRDQVAATASAVPNSSLFSRHSRAVLAAADELHATSRLTDVTAATLRETYDDGQLLELLMLAGWYHLIAFVAVGAGVELEPWGARYT